MVHLEVLLKGFIGLTLGRKAHGNEQVVVIRSVNTLLLWFLNVHLTLHFLFHHLDILIQASEILSIQLEVLLNIKIDFIYIKAISTMSKSKIIGFLHLLSLFLIINFWGLPLRYMVPVIINKLFVIYHWYVIPRAFLHWVYLFLMQFIFCGNIVVFIILAFVYKFW